MPNVGFRPPIHDVLVKVISFLPEKDFTGKAEVRKMVFKIDIGDES